MNPFWLAPFVPAIGLLLAAVFLPPLLRRL